MERVLEQSAENNPLWMRVLIWAEEVDRRVIYLVVALSLGLTIFYEYRLPPAPMPTAEKLFAAVDALKPAPGKIVLIAADWGPGTQAENQPQTALVIEHLMRKRIPLAMISTYTLSTPFLKDVPEEIAKKLESEIPGEKWTYGKDWVNLGFKPGFFLMIQGLAKATDFHTVLKTDVRSIPLSDIECMKDVHTIEDVLMLVEVTGLVGAFNSWLQFFRTDDYTPPIVHGCTSVTIPEAYIYLATRQIVGLFEGMAGAAAYDHLLDELYPTRKQNERIHTINTSLGIAQLMTIVFIIIGNVSYLLRVMRKRRTS